MSRRVAIMRATCEELGMKFVLETAPDPTSDVGVAGAQQYILEKVPAWIESYGRMLPSSAPTMLTRALLKRFWPMVCYFIEADLPSPLMGYPGAWASTSLLRLATLVPFSRRLSLCCR
jgi:hypothetical protein